MAVFSVLRMFCFSDASPFHLSLSEPVPARRIQTGRHQTCFSLFVCLFVWGQAQGLMAPLLLPPFPCIGLMGSQLQAALTEMPSPWSCLELLEKSVATEDSSCGGIS